jgi:hypothetical protein
MKRGTFVGRSSKNCCSSACIAKIPAVCVSRERETSVLERANERETQGGGTETKRGREE